MKLEETDNPKLQKTSIELILKPVEGKVPKTNTGLVDPEFFTGNNKLFLNMDSKNLLWSFKYAKGGPPTPLKQKFTNLTSALNFAKQYFNKRNIQITEVLD